MYRQALYLKMALSVVMAFARRHQIQPHLPVDPIKIIEWLEVMVGDLASFPSALVTCNAITPAVWNRRLKQASEAPLVHRCRGHPFPDGVPT